MRPSLQVLACDWEGETDLDEASGRDYEYVHPIDRPSSPMTSSSLEPVSESDCSIDPSNIGEGKPEAAGRGRNPARRGRNRPHCRGVCGVGRRAVGGACEGPDALMTDYEESVSGESGGADDSELDRDGKKRPSTKMRVATPAYLWKFARNPEKLREAFHELRDRPSDQVPRYYCTSADVASLRGWPGIVFSTAARREPT